MKRVNISLAIALSLSGCSTARPNLPYGPAAYVDFPASADSQAARLYRIGPLDTIAITVFQEPDLSVKDVPVDAAGTVVLPLIGSVRAQGKTTTEFGVEIARLLGSRYLVDPQVSVLVQESASQRVTVEGSVTEPGVYQIRGRTTLLDALAMAKGPTRVADLNSVVIFRDIDGRQMGALFNVSMIRRGDAGNPEILGSDTVVVGLSNIKAAWRDVLTAAPLVAVFRPFN